MHEFNVQHEVVDVRWAMCVWSAQWKWWWRTRWTLGESSTSWPHLKEAQSQVSVQTTGHSMYVCWGGGERVGMGGMGEAWRWTLLAQVINQHINGFHF